MSKIAEKYDRLAERFSDNSYADEAAYMEHRRDLVMRWGPVLSPGDTVLELGCGDGSTAERLVSAGLSYTGIDISPGMIECARMRPVIVSSRTARFVVADVQNYVPDGPVDAGVAFMRAFFTYMKDPEPIISRLAAVVRKKIILDINPRIFPLKRAKEMLRDAGFTRIQTRGFFVPSSHALPEPFLSFLKSAETTPLLKDLLLAKKFHALICAEPTK